MPTQLLQGREYVIGDAYVGNKDIAPVQQDAIIGRAARNQEVASLRQRRQHAPAQPHSWATVQPCGAIWLVLAAAESVWVRAICRHGPSHAGPWSSCLMCGEVYVHIKGSCRTHICC